MSMRYLGRYIIFVASKCFILSLACDTTECFIPGSYTTLSWGLRPHPMFCVCSGGQSPESAVEDDMAMSSIETNSPFTISTSVRVGRSSHDFGCHISEFQVAMNTLASIL